MNVLCIDCGHHGKAQEYTYDVVENIPGGQYFSTGCDLMCEKCLSKNVTDDIVRYAVRLGHTKTLEKTISANPVTTAPSGLFLNHD